MSILHQYTNGNTHVVLHDDGTKERTYLGNAPVVIHPESIDVKITNYCDAGCGFCHEKSTIRGQHADLNQLATTLSELPPGVELSCGGGNPLSHPALVPFLKLLKKRGLVPNITVNQKHIARYKTLLLNLIEQKLVYGVGISYNNPIYLAEIKDILAASDNVVFHLIMGVNSVADIDTLYDFCGKKPCKILVLGYKSFGFGQKYSLIHDMRQKNYDWYTKIATYFKWQNMTLSFDNLAIEQLKLRRFFTDEAWNQFYMGNDGQWTMYIDAVNKEYAVSSTSINRVLFKGCGLINYFQKRASQ